jgi:NADPH:quinone reductase-like Zn-dependent oxidoreductase
MKIPGVEYAGVIEEVGSQVTSFSQGDLISGTTTGLSFGANAEYVCVPEKPQMGVITQKPANISFKDAACTPSLAANGKFVSVKSPTREKVEDFQFVLKLVESGEVKPVIDKEYPLEQITEAHRYVDSGRKKGNLAIKVYG